MTRFSSPHVDPQVDMSNNDQIRTQRSDSQPPQASASTNSAIRAQVSFTDAVSHDPGAPSSASEYGEKFSTGPVAERLLGDGPVNQMRPMPPTSWKVAQYRDRVRAQAAIAASRRPACPVPVPPQLAFRCVVIDMATLGAGVYLLLQDGVVVYVGSSVNVAGRVGSHTHGHEHKEFNRVLFLPCDRNIRLRLEGALIRFFEPKHNGHPPTDGQHDADVLRSLKLPTMDPELAKLIRMRRRLNKMTGERRRFGHMMPEQRRAEYGVWSEPARPGPRRRRTP
jgi:hypothetical protein